jgi:hypothetical protein
MFVPDALIALAATPPVDPLAFTRQEKLVMWAIFLAFLGALYGAYLWARARAKAQEEEFAAEAERFEREALKQVAPAAASALPSPATADFNPAVPTSPPPPPPVAAPASPPPPAGQVDTPPATVEELARRLTALGIVTDLEGQLPMPIPPNGLIYRMRRGGHVLLLPRIESDAFMAHQAKRFDLVLVLTSTGEVLSMTRLQAKLSELLEIAG